VRSPRRRQSPRPLIVNFSSAGLRLRHVPRSAAGRGGPSARAISTPASQVRASALPADHAEAGAGPSTGGLEPRRLPTFTAGTKERERHHQGVQRRKGARNTRPQSSRPIGPPRRGRGHEAMEGRAASLVSTAGRGRPHTGVTLNLPAATCGRRGFAETPCHAGTGNSRVGRGANLGVTMKQIGEGVTTKCHRSQGAGIWAAGSSVSAGGSSAPPRMVGEDLRAEGDPVFRAHLFFSAKPFSTWSAITRASPLRTGRVQNSRPHRHDQP